MAARRAASRRWLLRGCRRAAGAESADARIRAQREELERIRRERAELERRMANLQGNVHDLREEVANLDRQREATERVIKRSTPARGDHQRRRRDDDAHGGAERELAPRRATLQRQQ